MPFEKKLTLSRYYRWSWYGVLGAASALAMASQVIPPLMICIMGFLSILSVSLPRYQVERHIRLLRLAIGLGLTALFAYEIQNYRDLAHGIRIMIEMIIGALPLTLLTFQEKRSYWLSILNVTVVAIGSVALGTSATTFAAFLLFVLALVLSLNSANLYLGNRDFVHRIGDDTLPRWYLLHVFEALPAGFLTAILIFYLFPRAHSFTFGLSLKDDHSLTGYSGIIDLRSTGPLERSSSLALLVEASNVEWLRRHEDDLLLRGNALHAFNGERWDAAVGPTRPLGTQDGIPLALGLDQQRQTLEMHLEPNSHLKLFYPEVLVRMLERPNLLGTLVVGPDDALSRSSDGLKRFSYTIKIAERKSLAGIGQMSVQEVVKRVPDTLKPLLDLDPRLSQAPWFQRWIYEVSGDSSETIATFAARITQYFARNFRPTLRAVHQSVDPLKDFLMDQKEGHCEYFATATALLLRAKGIPSRVVVGYRGGVFNNLIQALEVREDHAHAWTEVWLPDLGWYAIDTTPPTLYGGGVKESLTQVMNAINFLFHKYIVNYDQSTQKELLNALQSLAQGQVRSESWSWERTLSLLKVSLSPGVVLFSVGIVVVIWRRRRVSNDWPLYYQRFLRRMKKKGFQRDPGESLRTFHERILTSGGLTTDDIQNIQEINIAIEKDLYKKDPE